MTFKDKISKYLNLNEAELEDILQVPSFSKLPDISNNEEVKKAINRIKTAKSNNEKILIYGDYDCDGITAATIIYDTLKSLGIQVSYYIPSRYLDGYGLTLDNAKKIKKANFDIIFTVDNGVKCNEALDFAAKNDLDMIILDHHEYDSVDYPYVSLMHPKTVGLEEPSVSAGYLSYLFRRTILSKDDDYHFILGATSLLSDSMALTSYNHLSVKLALQLLNKDECVEYKLLANKVILDYQEVDLNFQIIPAINAIGRLVEDSTINRVVKYLSCYTSFDEKVLLSKWIVNINSKRKELTKNAAENIKIDESKPGIVVVTDLPVGVNGQLGNRYLREYNKPVCVLGLNPNDNNRYVGSLRSSHGCNLQKMFDYLDIESLNGGGHAFAAGISFDTADLDLFIEQYNKFAGDNPLKDIKVEPITLDLDEISYDSYRTVREFAPFGYGFEAPQFEVKVRTNDLTFTRDNRFLQTRINGISVFSFNYGLDYFRNKKIGEFVSLRFNFEKNEFRDKIYPQCMVNDIEF